ncbi:MAG: hypothetical protein HC769_21775 [Cyanobacteria bacterium CRU_2_1]|nr:hypothetical protein [Cyanobacteria bacterium CRU_2_1]
MSMTRENFLVTVYQAGQSIGLKLNYTLFSKEDFDRLTREDVDTEYVIVEDLSSFVLVDCIPRCKVSPELQDATNS